MRFESVVYVPEDAEEGTFVTQVFARDADTGQFAEIMYFLTGGDNGRFIINSVTVSECNLLLLSLNPGGFKTPFVCRQHYRA